MGSATAPFDGPAFDGPTFDGPTFDGPTFDGRARYALDPQVALRPEPFGALAYHYGSRRLTFLRSKLLADLVSNLGAYESVDVALANRVPDSDRPSYRRALASLATSEFIHAV